MVNKAIPLICISCIYIYIHGKNSIIICADNCTLTATETSLQLGKNSAVWNIVLSTYTRTIAYVKRQLYVFKKNQVVIQIKVVIIFWRKRGITGKLGKSHLSLILMAYSILSSHFIFIFLRGFQNACLPVCQWANLSH